MPNKAPGIVIGCFITALVTACGESGKPPAFPDLSSYKPVDPADYQIAFDNPGRQPTEMVYFLSPGDVVCVVDSWGAACIGKNLPGVPPVSNPETRVHYMDSQRGLYEANDPGYIVLSEVV